MWQALRTARDASWLSFPRAAFAILVFYLLLTCLWFQNWYAVWPLALAALFPPGYEMRLAVLLGYAGLAKPLIFEPLWLWQRPLPVSYTHLDVYKRQHDLFRPRTGSAVRHGPP